MRQAKALQSISSLLVGMVSKNLFLVEMIIASIKIAKAKRSWKPKEERPGPRPV